MCHCCLLAQAAQLETLGRNMSCLHGQLREALQDLAAEQQRHEGDKTAEDLQSQLLGVQQELLAERQVKAATQVCHTPAVLLFSVWGCLSLGCTDCIFWPHLPDDTSLNTHGDQELCFTLEVLVLMQLH